MKTSRAPLVISLVFFAAFLLPIFYLYYGAYLFNKNVIDLSIFIQERGPLINSLETGVGSAILGTVLGTIYAWIVVRTDVPLRRLLSSLPLLALGIPLIIKAFAWIFLLNPSNGIINTFLVYVFHLSGAPFSIYGLWGIIFVAGLGGMPLAYLILSPALASMDTTLEEASKVVGNSSIMTSLRITLPLILPALASVSGPASNRWCFDA